MCGGELVYLLAGQPFTCIKCGQKEVGYVYCPQGHYICDACHGKDVFNNILDHVYGSQETNPLLIAEEMLEKIRLPMLGCEHALIAAAAFLTAVKNEGKISISSQQVAEAMERTRKQSIGAFCGLTGICGIAVGIGAGFSMILGASCAADYPTAITMKAVSRVIERIAGQAGPCCCKNFLRQSLVLSADMADEYLQIKLPPGGSINCTYSEHHPHGCREGKCDYYIINSDSKSGG